MNKQKKKVILFVYPADINDSGKLIKGRKAFMPCRTFPYLAALTPKEYEVKIVQEGFNDLDFDVTVDLVALSGMLHHFPRLIEISKKFREKNIPTILGGVGVFALNDLIKENEYDFDSIVIGEADMLWTTVLKDFENNSLKPKYSSCQNKPDLINIPFSRYDLLNSKKYMKSFIDFKSRLVLIETARGCPNYCKFCLVPRYLGRKMRYRPIDEVVEEIKYQKSKFIFFTDDNILVNPKRTKELLKAIKPLGLHWYAQFDVSAIKYPEILKMASDSGCVAAFIGMESLNIKNFISVNKKKNYNTSLKELVKVFNDSKIIPMISMIFGMDYDTSESIKHTFEELVKCHVNVIFPWILTPIPGTPLFEEYERDGRLLHKNFEYYDNMHVVIRPKSITPEELKELVWKGLRDFYSIRGAFKRVLFRKDILSVKLPVRMLFYNFMIRYQIKRGYHPSANFM